ncbi:TetR/AcrR family transcriptional regulator [uncultured Methanosphaera sp.]|uniref:TetR/AcrR family transcriptional regulator n=1 Tax=uncultured Methanosphaera sp. TaxID=262501 RepID=UPI0025D7F591|nr:TetR/AcrR family transcriptional regulator [uncultured Methanosphaera sp.]
MNTKEEIAESLITLMKNKDFENITVKEITGRARVNRSTYYRNFKSKEDILKYKLGLIMDEYMDSFKEIKEKTKKDYIYTILSTYSKHKDVFLVMHQAKQTYLLQQVYMEYFQNKIKNPSTYDLYKTYYHMGGIYNFTICWIEHGMADNLEELATIGAEITEQFDPVLVDI